MEIPETLELNRTRIAGLNAHFHTDVQCTIIIATVLQVLTYHVLAFS